MAESHAKLGRVRLFHVAGTLCQSISHTLNYAARNNALREGMEETLPKARTI